jgi:hypothetical protein
MSRAPAALEPTRPALACVLLCRFPRQVCQRQRNPSAGPANKALGFRFGSGAACCPVAPGTNGQQKRRTYMYTMNQLTMIGFTGNDAEAHYTQNVLLL